MKQEILGENENFYSFMGGKHKKIRNTKIILSTYVKFNTPILIDFTENGVLL